MLKHFIFSLFIINAVIRAADDPKPAFHALVDQYYEEYLSLYPIEAAINGDNDSRYESVWPNDLSAEHRAKVTAMCGKYLAAIAKFDRGALSPTDQLSYDTLKWDLAIRQEGAEQIFHLIPVDQFSCATLTFAQMGSGAYIHPFKTAQDFRNFLSRAKGFSVWVDTAISNMREGIKKGVVQPRILMERVLAQLEPLMVDDQSANILFAPLRKLPSGISPVEQSRLAAEYANGIRAIMLPSYARLRHFIQDDYLPHCRATAGIGALPGGKEAYAYAVRLQTTTDLTPGQIHDLGLREVARIRAEIDKVRSRAAFDGSFKEFLRYVANDSKFAPYKTDEQVLNGYREIENRVMIGAPKLFQRLPRTKFEIRATEKFRAATASAEYIAGTADGSRPGIFFVPIPDAAKFRATRMEDLFLHEAIPGHHFQLSLALENPGLPRFRRYDANNAYVEGWALYCESIGKELGMYSDPFQYLGMLLGDMHRAIRLVVDTGIHAMNWSRAEALAYAAENEGGSDEQNQSEIERYMAAPGQALGYKIGQLNIRELRSFAEGQLGANFDIRAFHEQVLSEGALPLAVLDANLKAWIARATKP